MRVDSLPTGRDQPFYHVLVDERDRKGSQTTYVAADNISLPRQPREVQHPLVPHFFSAFVDGRYIASAALREAYPEDEF